MLIIRIYKNDLIKPDLLTIDREETTNPDTIGETVARLSLNYDYFKNLKKTPKNNIINKWVKGASNAEEARAQLLAL